METPKLSVVILTKNEEEMLPACLASVDWADERLVVDSFSTDKTVDIAREAGAKVLQHVFEGFASQFNWGIEQASGEWILMLDADETVDAELAEAIRVVLSSKLQYEVYTVVRDAFFLGKRIRSRAWSGERLPRLFRKGALVYKGLVHPETDTGDRKRGELRGRILHDTYRTLEQYFEKMQLYTTLWAKDAHAAGKKVGVAGIFVSGGWKFFRHYFLRGFWRDGRYGLLISGLSAVYVVMKYAKLWDRNRAGPADGRG